MAITLATLCGTLPEALRPVDPIRPTTVPVTGVHVSELIDPGPFLDGGELLLTTGLSVTEDTDVDAYIGRLAARRVSGIALGLGLTHEVTPDSWRRACRRYGVALLAVPEEAPFQAVIRELWAQTSAARPDVVRAAMGAAHSLVRAALAESPEYALVRSLADALGGWAGAIGADGAVRQVYPAAREADARRVADEIRRMRLDGPHSAVSFPSGDHDVMVHAVDGRGTAASHLVAGCPPPMPSHARHLVLSACALLSLREQYSRPQIAVQVAAPAVLGTLLRFGHVTAAADLAHEWGHSLPASVRIAVVGGPSTDEVGAVAIAAGGFVTLGDPVMLVLPTVTAPGALTRLRHLLRDCAAPSVRGVVTRAAAWTEAPRLMLQAEDAFDRTAPGTFRDLTETRLPGASTDLPGLDELAAYPRADLVATLASYLRHRGRVEPVATELGLHRNSVRHRLGIIRDVIDVDIDDPDVAARWWLVLRARGLA